MEATVGFGVGGEFLSFVVDLSGAAEVVFEGFGEIVVVDEVVAGVVGRVDVDHFYAVGVGLLHDLEYFEVFAFDEDVAGVIGAVGVGGSVGFEALSVDGSEGTLAGDGGEAAGFFFAGPEEAEAFGVVGDGAFGFQVRFEDFAEGIEVEPSVFKRFGDDLL